MKTADGSIDMGIEWKLISVTEEGSGFFQSIRNGVSRTGELLHLTVKSIGLLFKGVNMTEAVAGPIRISSLIGAVAQESFSSTIKAGIANVADIVAVICVSLFLMNLLPVPILDGGLILFAFIEMIARREIPPRVLYYVQFIGIAFIAVLFFFALWADVLFIFK